MDLRKITLGLLIITTLISFSACGNIDNTFDEQQAIYTPGTQLQSGITTTSTSTTSSTVTDQSAN